MEERTLYVGMDMRENKIQLCAYPPGGSEIQMLLQDFPLLLAIEEEKKEWLYGEEALEKQEKGEGIVISDFLRLLEEKEELIVYGVRFSVVELLSKVIKRVLLSMKREFPNDLIRQLTVSVEEPTQKQIKKLKRAFLKLGIDEDRLRVESHGRSFLYYVLNQKKELWMGEAGLLDGSDGQLVFWRLFLDKRKSPMVAGAFRQTLSKEQLEGENLQTVVKPEIGTLYLTGSYFTQTEKTALLQSLCRGRRGFLGENLYCQGACISSRQQAEPDWQSSFLLLEEESIKWDITIPVYHDAKDGEAFLAKASQLWYETEKEVCLVLDEEEEIPLKLSSALTGEEKLYILALEGLWKRPPRMTKLCLRLRFVDRVTCIVTAKDLGFGEFYPSSQRIWEKTITI